VQFRNADLPIEVTSPSKTTSVIAVLLKQLLGMTVIPAGIVTVPLREVQ
jgi:hypothetical protein